jgi:hypothetical protein
LKKAVVVLVDNLARADAVTTAVRRDGYGDVIFIRPADRVDWMRPGDHVTFSVMFNYKGPLAVELRPRRQDARME